MLSPNESIYQILGKEKLFIVTKGRLEIYTDRKQGMRFYCKKKLKEIIKKSLANPEFPDLQKPTYSINLGRTGNKPKTVFEDILMGVDEIPSIALRDKYSGGFVNMTLSLGFQKEESINLIRMCYPQYLTEI